MDFLAVIQISIILVIFVVLVWIVSVLAKLDKLVTLLYRKEKLLKNGGSNESSS